MLKRVVSFVGVSIRPSIISNTFVNRGFHVTRFTCADLKLTNKDLEVKLKTFEDEIVRETDSLARIDQEQLSHDSLFRAKKLCDSGLKSISDFRAAIENSNLEKHELTRAIHTITAREGFLLSRRADIHFSNFGADPSNTRSLRLALTDLESAYNINPNNLQPLYLMASATYDITGDSERAIQYIDRAMKVVKEQVASIKKQYNSKPQQKEFDPVAHGNQDVSAFYALRGILLTTSQLKRYQEAQEMFTTAIKYADKYAHPDQQKAQLYIHRAVSRLEHVLSNEPEPEPEPEHFTAKSVLKDLNYALELDPDNYFANLHLGTYYRVMEYNVEQLLYNLRRYRREAVKHIEAGDWEAISRVDKIIEYFQVIDNFDELVRNNPDKPDYYVQRAMHYLHLYSFTEAENAPSNKENEYADKAISDLKFLSKKFGSQSIHVLHLSSEIAKTVLKNNKEALLRYERVLGSTDEDHLNYKANAERNIKELKVIVEKELKMVENMIEEEDSALVKPNVKK